MPSNAAQFQKAIKIPGGINHDFPTAIFQPLRLDKIFNVVDCRLLRAIAGEKIW
jgi:hypothetical protein